MIVIDGVKYSLRELFSLILKPDAAFYYVIAIYGIAVSLLTLAVPISVQALIGSVINLSLLQPIVVLTVVLFFLLSVSAVLNALQTYVIEIFERRFFARITKEIVLKNIHAKFAFYEQVNRSEIINRYFEVFNIQKDLSFILISTFALILQTIVGVVVVSFYHPFLLLFNILLIASCYLVWKIWGKSTISYSLQHSHSKYKIIRWIEDLARANSFFKSDKPIKFALTKSEQLTDDYINTRKKFFAAGFKQKIAFLAIYAAASALLLSVGGKLVVEGQLTTGQLVASELILSTILFGISKFGYHFEIFYRLCASVEELANLFNIPSEDEGGDMELISENFDIEYDSVKSKHNNTEVGLDLFIKSNAKILVSAEEFSIEKTFLQLIKNYKRPEFGSIKIGEKYITDYKLENLRQNVISIDTSVIIEGKIQEYLKIGNPKISNSEILNVLKLVCLDKTIAKLPKGLDTFLTPSGNPLSENEVLKLKLAWAIISKPKILIINSLFDKIAYFKRKSLIKYLCSIPNLTFIYFSNRKDLTYFDQYIYLQNGKTNIFHNVESFREFENNLHITENNHEK